MPIDSKYKIGNELDYQLINSLTGKVVLKGTTLTKNLSIPCYNNIKDDDRLAYFNKNKEINLTIDNAQFDQFALSQLMGMKVIETELIMGYKQTKTHKRKRINKKWLKIYGKTPIYDDNIYIINEMIITSKNTINKIRKGIDLQK